MSLPRYPKYKDSGVEWLGEVPEHWQVKRIAVLCLQNNRSPRSQELARDYLGAFLTQWRLLDNDGSFDLDDGEKMLSKLIRLYVASVTVDVVIARMTPCLENWQGRSYAVAYRMASACTTELIVCKPDLGSSNAGTFINYFGQYRSWHSEAVIVWCWWPEA